MQPNKKIHPNGLPHLSDAKNHADLVAGGALWAPKVNDGTYQFIVAEEHAIDDVTDVAVIVRKKVK